MQARRQPLSAKALVAALACLFAAPAAAQEAVGMKLEDAGFVMKRADTARKMERLRTLPPRRFVMRMKAGTPFYIYADPDYCKCALIGNQRAMTAYRDMVAPVQLPPGVSPQPNDPNVPAAGPSLEREMIQDMNEDGDSQAEDDIFHPGF
jgi:hypothetical protein